MSKKIDYATTIEVRDACLCLHAQRAARALARRFDEALRPVGLTNGQFSLLMAINRPEPAKLGALAAFLAMDRTTLTAAVKPLARDGLLSIETDPDDRRGRRLILTAAGHARLADAMPLWRATHAELEARLPAGEADDLRASLIALSAC